MREEGAVYKVQEGRLPETSEVVIGSHSHAPPSHLRNPVARGLRPSYAASARRVLMDSARGLARLQDSLTSNLSSLYVNDSFEDGVPCRVLGCPLNPATRVSGGQQ